MESADLSPAQISVAQSKVYCKLCDGSVKDLAQDTVYTHPTEKQCSWEPSGEKYIFKTGTGSVTENIGAKYDFTIHISDIATILHFSISGIIYDTSNADEYYDTSIHVSYISGSAVNIVCASVHAHASSRNHPEFRYRWFAIGQ